MVWRDSGERGNWRSACGKFLTDYYHAKKQKGATFAAKLNVKVKLFIQPSIKFLSNPKIDGLLENRFT